MKLFENCIFACDVDGTLVHNGEIPETNLEKIKFFTENGGIFSLATGRSVAALDVVTSKIGNLSASVVLNGCVIYDYKENKILYEKTIPKNEYSATLKLKKEHPEIGIEVHSGEKAYVLNRTKETDNHEFYEQMPCEPITDEQFLNIKANKILYALNSAEESGAVRAFIEKDLKQSRLIDTAATLMCGRRHYLEQIPENVSKANGVLKLAEILNVKKGGLFAAGDYYNDAEMLKEADISCSPQEAPEEIKKYVTFVGPNAENGTVAGFIDYLTDLRRK